MATYEPFKTMLFTLGPERSDIMIAQTCYTVHHTRGAMYDNDIFTMLAALVANGAFANFFPQAPLAVLPAPEAVVQPLPLPLTCDESQDDAMPQSQTVVSLPPAPKYEMRQINRGTGPDTFFNKPLVPYTFMTDNSDLIKTLGDASDEDVLDISNFANQTPGIKPKCDEALISKFFVDATYLLITEYGIDNLADIYRRLGFMSDRVCLGCANISPNTVCLSGSWRCKQCNSHGRVVGFDDGFKAWMTAGSPIRHGIVL
jgi:hypothetical protein